MHVFVHGFFGKEAIETIAENDVIELAIDDAILNSVFKEYVQLLVSSQIVNENGPNSALNQSFDRQCVMKPEQLPLLIRTIIKMINLHGHSFPELNNLLQLVTTAKRHNKDIYWC